MLAMALLSSYLIGSFPTGYLLVKWIKGMDVRTMGSGSVGATNVTRAAGSGAGRLVFLIDVGKGLLAATVLAPWLVRPATPAVQLSCGLAAVAGHCFPVFLQFHGGKGVATTIGVLLGVMPAVAGIALGVWVACFLLWRYVSVGSLAAAVTIPIAQYAMRQPWPDTLLGVALALLIIARHRDNIARLLQGREHRFGRKGSEAQDRHGEG